MVRRHQAANPVAPANQTLERHGSLNGGPIALGLGSFRPVSKLHSRSSWPGDLARSSGAMLRTGMSLTRCVRLGCILCLHSVLIRH